MIVVGPGSEKIGSSVIDILGVEKVLVNYKTFPDGEAYLCLYNDIKSNDAVIIHSTGPPQNDRLIQLVLLI